MRRTAVIILSLTLLAAFSSNLSAQPFQHEFKFDISEVSENYTASDKSGNALGYTYFFSQVENLELPFREAEFGSRVSKLGVHYAIYDSETRNSIPGTYTYSTSGEEATFASVLAEYKHERTGWFVAGKLSKGEIEQTLSQDDKAIQITLGKYLTPLTTISFEIEKSEEKDEPYELNVPGFLPSCGWQPSGAFIVCSGPLPTFTIYTYEGESETDSYSVSGRHLQEISGTYFAFGLSYTKNDTTDSTVITVGGAPPSGPLEFSYDFKIYSGAITAYWNRGFSTQINYSTLESDGVGGYLGDPKTLGVSTEYFFLPGVSLSFNYALLKSDTNVPLVAPVGSPIGFSPFGAATVNNDQELFSIGLRGRF